MTVGLDHAEISRCPQGERTAALVGHQALQDMRGAVEAAQKRVSSARASLKAAQDASKKAAAATDDPPAQVLLWM